MYIIAIAYLCEDFSGEPLSDPGEVTELRWFDLSALPENISPPDAELLRQGVERIRAGV